MNSLLTARERANNKYQRYRRIKDITLKIEKLVLDAEHPSIVPPYDQLTQLIVEICTTFDHNKWSRLKSLIKEWESNFYKNRTNYLKSNPDSHII